MTNKDIDKLQAGRELDALVAEKVMGWCDHPGHKIHSVPQGERGYGKPNIGKCECGIYVHVQSGRLNPPDYSTSISAAWEVVEKFKYGYISKIVDDMEDVPINWACELSNDYNPIFDSEAPTAPLAICRAALKAANSSLANSQS